jgi:hypothetical protein
MLTRRNLKPAKFLRQRIWVHLWLVNQPLEPKASQIGKSALPTIRVRADQGVTP